MTSKPRDGFVAVVTGGESGIGQACTEQLRWEGATVAVIDSQGPDPVDITDETALAAFADRMRREHGKVDLLINCAGIVGTNRPAADYPAAEFRQFLDVNLLGTFFTCRALHPLLREAKGAIVNTASQAALVSLPEQSAYSASKGGVTALTRSLAIDWAPDGIRVNAVAPGVVVTPMTAAFRENEAFVRAVERRIALGRMIEASEVAEAIIFLGTAPSSAITGIVLPVDGGWTIGEPGLPW
jgi:meso-butanediol dehydrogenase / (S,S)-butanediol dehydrogenase / diacetyl reductase